MGRFLGQPLTVRAGNFRTVLYVPVFLFLDDGGDSFRMFAYYYMNGIDMDEVDYGKPESTDAERPWGWNKG